MAIRFILLLLFNMFSLHTSYAQVAEKTTPDEVIQKLINSSVLDGVNAYYWLPPDQHTPAVKAALVQALENENERTRKIVLGGESDMTVYRDHSSAEAALSLAKLVRALRDPTTIPVLLPWLCCGGEDEMIDFGRQAFEPVLRFVEVLQPGIDQYALAGGLYTLRMMVDYWSLTTFSLAEQDRMRQVAAKYIVGYKPNSEENSSLPIIYAVHLAASLQDTALLHMAHALVNNDAEMRKRGFTDRQMLQEATSKALAGMPDGQRQYIPYEVRKQM